MQFHGRAQIKIDGDMVNSLPGATLNIGGVEREAKPTDSGVVGYIEKTVPATLEVKVPMDKDLSPAKLAAVIDSTITYIADTGQTFILSHAFVTEPPTITSGDGEVDLKISAGAAEEVT